MQFKRLFVWVEGEDDRRFFDKIIKPKLNNKYHFIETICFATMKIEKVDKYIKSVKEMDEDYIYVVDINNVQCVNLKKQIIKNRLKNIDSDRIVVVIKEIESWYLAGIDEKTSLRLKIREFNNTNNITKEVFNKLIPRRFDSRIDFMLEILKNFSIEVARRKNKSFKYFIDKYDCVIKGN